MKPRKMRSCGFTRHPSSQVSRSTPGVPFPRPVVISGGNRRMIPVGEMPRFRHEPVLVPRVWYSHERKGSTKSVDYLLVVPPVATQPPGSPLPSGRQLPTGNMIRQRRRLTPSGRRASRTAHSAAFCSVIVTRVPLFTSLAISIVAPHDSSSRRLIARPSPLPAVRVEK